jgi:hypothetical protein
VAAAGEAGTPSAGASSARTSHLSTGSSPLTQCWATDWRIETALLPIAAVCIRSATRRTVGGRSATSCNNEQQQARHQAAKGWVVEHKGGAYAPACDFGQMPGEESISAYALAAGVQYGRLQGRRMSQTRLATDVPVRHDAQNGPLRQDLDDRIARTAKERGFTSASAFIRTAIENEIRHRGGSAQHAEDRVAASLDRVSCRGKENASVPTPPSMPSRSSLSSISAGVRTPDFRQGNPKRSRRDQRPKLAERPGFAPPSSSVSMLFPGQPVSGPDT